MEDDKIIIVSGPSGAGKSSLCKELLRVFENMYFSISSTTRNIRDGEIDGVHYDFITRESFLDGIEHNMFLEWAMVHGNYYGTKKDQVQAALDRGNYVLLDVDVQGQKSIKQFYPNAVSIFITTPNREILESRLNNRALDSKKIIESRVAFAIKEMESIHNFDFVLINDDFNIALDGLLSIVKSMALRNNKSLSSRLVGSWC